MSLSEEIEQELGINVLCSAGQAIRSFPAADQAGLERAFAADPKRIPSEAISRVLRNHDLVIDASTIAKHRKGMCRCPHSTTS